MKKLPVILFGVVLLGGAIVFSACAPEIPHTIDGRQDCLECHQTGSVRPYPIGHAEKNLQNNSCEKCHEILTENEK